MTAPPRRRPGEPAFLLALLGASLLLLREAWRIDGVPGPSTAGLVPTLAAATMAGCLVLVLGRRLRAPGREPEPLADTFRRFTATVLPPRVAGLAALLLLYLLALGPIGFLASSLLFLLAAMALLGWRRPLPLLLAAGGTVAVVRLVFATLFGVQLP
jgi:putative tricarboxylic transport membrane protein